MTEKDKKRINIRREKILQDRFDYLFEKEKISRKEVSEMNMLEKRIEKLSKKINQ